MTDAPAMWRNDLDSLVFRPRGHEGACVVHRRAFGSLLEWLVSPAGCATFFADNRAAFDIAAAQKIARHEIASDVNFHLTSRDIRRALAEGGRLPADPPGAADQPSRR